MLILVDYHHCLSILFIRAVTWKKILGQFLFGFDGEIHGKYVLLSYGFWGKIKEFIWVFSSLIQQFLQLDLD